MRGGQRTEPESGQPTEEERRRQPEEMREYTPNLRPTSEAQESSPVTPKAQSGGTRKGKGRGDPESTRRTGRRTRRRGQRAFLPERWAWAAEGPGSRVFVT